VGDTGVLDFGGELIAVTDTKKENNLIIHFTETLPADIKSPVMLQKWTITKGNQPLFTTVQRTCCMLHCARYLVRMLRRKEVW
jgi:alanyl-tRNA synthetase